MARSTKSMTDVPQSADGAAIGGVSRRQFLRVTAAGALALYSIGPRGVERLMAAPIPGGTLTPGTIPKFVTPLVIPPAMPNTGTAHRYDIAVRQFVQQILPAGLPPTTVWSYGAAGAAGTLNYPAFTIEARRGSAVTVKWINDLKDASGNYLPHLLPVDPTRPSDR